MRHNVIKITDNKGQSFEIEVVTGGYWQQLWGSRSSDSSWQARDKGFIYPVGGPAKLVSAKAGRGIFATKDLLLGNPQSVTGLYYWGLILYSYDDNIGTNDLGRGLVQQPWCLALEPGLIRWDRLGVGAVVLGVMRRDERSFCRARLTSRR